MTRLIRTELLKLATVRLTYGLLAVAAALTALFSLLEKIRAGTSGTGAPAISTADGLRTVTTVTGFAMLVAAVLGSIVANGEFRHSTATLTYLATPRRARVLGRQSHRCGQRPRAVRACRRHHRHRRRAHLHRRPPRPRCPLHQHPHRPGRRGRLSVPRWVSPWARSSARSWPP